MSLKIGNGLDLQQTQIYNPVIHTLNSAPSSPKAGQKYYNNTSNVGFTYNGMSWRPDDAAALTDGSIQISALSVNPLARANHTGTQIAATISDLATTVQSYRLDQFAAPTVSVSFSSQRITNLLDPVNPQDGATKNYVDGAVQSAAAGIDSKASVRVIAVSSLTLSGLQTVDGVSLSAGDRVLASAQTTASQNGVYVVASGAWTRALDADMTGEITPGAFWFVEEGTSYGKTQWRCNNTGTVTLGTTAITIVQFGAANLYTADGTSLALTGNQFSVNYGSGLTISGSKLVVDTSVVARKYSTSITGDGTTTSFTITHGLGTQDITFSIRDSANALFLTDITSTSTTQATVTFGTAPANGVTHRVVVTG